MKRVLILLLLSCSIAATSMGASHQANPELLGRVEANLASHLDGEAIDAWVASLPVGSLEYEAAIWIMAWLPLSDLATLNLPLLRDHIDGACRSLREAPWGERIPHDIWLHYIVPHRVSQEPAQRWRQPLHEAIWPRVAHYDDMESAALAANRWCREQATFISTSGRDMGPLTTLKRGLGRCEEEMILTICALRSVGIPARSCATPYWTFCDNNHAWVEAWADGHWYFLGGCEPGKCLNDAWFKQSARRAGFVRSVAYGEFEPDGEQLYRAERGATLVNTTRVYTNPCLLTASAPDNGRLYVNVFNFGSLRPIARLDSNGSLEIGPGEYALTSAAENGLLLRVIRAEPGGTINVELTEADRYDLDSSPGFWLRYPEADAAPARDLDLVGEQERARLQSAIKARERERVKLAGLLPEEEEYLAQLDSTSRARLRAAISLPAESPTRLLLLHEGYARTGQGMILLDFYDLADDKTFLELSEAEIRAHIDGASSVRDRLSELGLAVEDDLFKEGVLDCRIDREPGCDWRSDLPLLPLGDDADSSLALLLAEFRDRMTRVEGGVFGTPLPPHHAWALGRGTDRDLGIALVGLARRNGFPARYRNGNCEIWLDQWQEISPLPAEESSEESAMILSGELTLQVTRGGKPWPAAESYRDFNISRLREGYLETPWWDPALGPQDWDQGEFIFCSGNRVPGGSVYARLKRFTLGDDPLTVSLPLDIAAEGWDGGALVAGAEPEDAIALIERNALPPAGLYFLFEDGEPAKRMLPLFAALSERLASADLPFIPVLKGSVEAGKWRALLAGNGMTANLHHLQDGSALGDDGGTFGPWTLLRAEDGRVLMLRHGLDLSVDRNAHLALELLERRVH